MKILRVVAPGHDEQLDAGMREAIAAFNRGVDIRLRFLSILVEQVEVRVAEPEAAAEQVNAAIDQERPAVALLSGHGETALAAAAACVRRGVPLARLGAGARHGEHADAARGIDRLSGQLLVLDAAAAAALEDEGLAERAVRVEGTDPAAVGARVIKALRALRARGGGERTC